MLLQHYKMNEKKKKKNHLCRTLNVLLQEYSPEYDVVLKVVTFVASVVLKLPFVEIVEEDIAHVAADGFGNVTVEP